MSNVEIAKPYQLSYELRPDYLYVLIKGERIDYKIARQYWDEIIEIRERENTRLLLVDKHVRAELSTVEEFEIATELATMVPYSVKLALCDRHVSPENLQFAELVATNRGLNTKSFRDTAAAEKWPAGKLNVANCDVPASVLKGRAFREGPLKRNCYI